MSEPRYDAIVVGARCAGSPTAMLLARKGHRVLVVDRATFPSDTISTHLVHPPGVASLRSWGLLERLIATGCPPIDTYSFDFGVFALTGAPGTADEPVAYGPRRTVLDKILVDAAQESGAEVREAFTVDELLFEDGRVVGIRGHAKGGESVEERARVVVGADGLRSRVAEAVEPDRYNEKSPLMAGYYTYWSGLPQGGRFETWSRPHRGMAAIPTHDDLTLVITAWPIAEFEANRKDIETHYMATIDSAPDFSERVRAARREERFQGMAVPGYFRRPYGPGWALVGDAGYNKDFITAMGISDAFRDAELCATALDEWLSGARPFDEAMAEYQSTRDADVLPMYEFTAGLASLEPPTPRVQQVLAAAAGNQEAMDGFARVNAGVTSPAEYFSEENVGRILRGAGE
ncbi:MAG TPA: NAD(P)/FAD-dependent oxidoreductase [Gemmatimonadota bacterium]|nr:NAD(P)/FAD-dependent oxidoreductase [Gemmatimonadota bacterium]